MLIYPGDAWLTPAIPASAITFIHFHEFHGLDNEVFAQP